jgi:hypothetical protein
MVKNSCSTLSFESLFYTLAETHNELQLGVHTPPPAGCGSDVSFICGHKRDAFNMT